MNHYPTLKTGFIIGTLFVFSACVQSSPEGNGTNQSSEVAGTSQTEFVVDPFWPKPLPNNWVLGQVSGIAVDLQDHIWIVHRPLTITRQEAGAVQDPPLSDCCVPAPSVIEFDQEGNIVQAWGGPKAFDYDEEGNITKAWTGPDKNERWPRSEHGLYVDHQNNVWIASNNRTDQIVLKFSKDGTRLMELGHWGITKGSNDTEHLGRPTDITVDPETNEVYISDGYGNRRIIVFDASTGEYKRHWGAYVFDRETGEPVWPMEERSVPKSDVPGEITSPTQRFPTWPKPFEIQGITIDDLIDFTPELREEAIKITKKHRMGPLFTPPSLANDPSGTQGTLVVPGANGGANIPGGSAVDPETGIIYIASQKGHSNISLVHDPKKSSMEYISLGPGGIRGPQGLPLLKPPYGHIIAIDLNTGNHLWDIPNGDTPDNIKNHPALEGVNIPRTGKSAHANLLITKSAMFAGEGRGGSPIFRVHNKKTGEIVAEIEIPATTNAAPMTYMANGKQYIVVAIAGPDFPAELVALAIEN